MPIETSLSAFELTMFLFGLVFLFEYLDIHEVMSIYDFSVFFLFCL
jgi:hypothetical protein